MSEPRSSCSARTGRWGPERGEHQNKVNVRVSDGERGLPSPAGRGLRGAGRRRGAGGQWEPARGGGFSILSTDLPPGRLLLCPQHAPLWDPAAELWCCVGCCIKRCFEGKIIIIIMPNIAFLSNLLSALFCVGKLPGLDRSSQKTTSTLDHIFLYLVPLETKGKMIVVQSETLWLMRKEFLNTQYNIKFHRHKVLIEVQRSFGMSRSSYA